MHFITYFTKYNNNDDSIYCHTNERMCTLYGSMSFFFYYFLSRSIFFFLSSFNIKNPEWFVCFLWILLRMFFLSFIGVFLYRSFFIFRLCVLIIKKKVVVTFVVIKSSACYDICADFNDAEKSCILIDLLFYRLEIILKFTFKVKRFLLRHCAWNILKLFINSACFRFCKFIIFFQWEKCKIFANGQGSQVNKTHEKKFREILIPSSFQSKF